MRTIGTAAFVGALAGCGSAQPDMLITVDNVSAADWTISAEILSPPSFQAIVQVWADTSFELTGDGSAITIISYNPSYDTTLGNAFVSNGPTATFIGNANSFFGIPDSSNPLFVLDFTYAGGFEELELQLVGQNSALFDNFGGSIDAYQFADGSPGNLTWDVQYIPAPATLALALAPITLIASRRRRK
ncbi:MAG: hypothetical protein AAFR76_12405 [Planctomycetota bacterium]